jgi:hypothetical protein
MKCLFLILSLTTWQTCDAFCTSTPKLLTIQRKNLHVFKAFEAVSINDSESDIDDFEADISTVLKEARSGKDTTFYPPEMAQQKSRLALSYVWDLQMWKQHTSRYRYLRDVRTMFSGRLFKRISPQLMSFVSWSTFYILFVAERFSKVKADMVPLTSLSLVSTFVGFLLTLRSNQGLARLSEGRTLFGRTFIVTRDTSQLLEAYVYPKDKTLGIMAARYLSLFPWLLKGGLRDTNDSDIVDIMLSETDSANLKSQRKKPAACIARIRQVVAEIAARNELPVAAHQQLETNLNEMNYILVSKTRAILDCISS